MKKIIYSILILVFCLGLSTSCFASETVDFNTLSKYIQTKFSNNLENANGVLDSFKASLASWTSFVVSNNLSTSTIPASGNYLYFIGSSSTTSPLTVDYGTSYINFSAPYGISCDLYSFSLDTDTFTKVNTSSSRLFMRYQKSKYPEISTLMDPEMCAYFISKCVVAGHNAIVREFEFNDFVDLVIEEPYFLNSPAGASEYDVDFLVDVISVFDLNIDDYYLVVTKYDLDKNPIVSTMIKDSSIWSGNRIDNTYRIILNNYYDFSGDYYYKVKLINSTLGELDSSDFFWSKDSNIPGDSGGIIVSSGDSSSGDSEGENLDEIKGGITNIFEAITNLPKLIIDGIAGIFIPGDGFLGAYFEELNTWFGDRLGILYFPFDFIVSFFNRIYNAEFGAPTIEIPAMKIPLFEEYGNIYDGTTFNFMEFVNQHETFKYIYNLYLIAIDGVIIFGLIRLLMKKYEEVTTNGN